MNINFLHRMVFTLCTAVLLPVSSVSAQSLPSKSFSRSSDTNTVAARSDICTAAPHIRTHKNGDTLNQNKDTLKWNSNGCHFYVHAGSTPDGAQYHNESMGSRTSLNLSNYPNDGSDVFFKLFYRNPTNGPWKTKNYRFTAPKSTGVCTDTPTITSHKKNAVLTPGSDILKWTSNGCHFWLHAGSQASRAQYHNQSMGSATSVKVTNYPSDGSVVHVRLLYRNPVAGEWKTLNQQFVAPR